MQIAQSKATEWDPLLLARYDTRGPRYTSYPGAQMFSGDYGLPDYRSDLNSLAKTGQPLSLYVHIPFCEDICYYCACNKIVTKDRSKAAVYLDYLRREAKLLAEAMGDNREVVSLHLGGGSPSYLDMGQLTELVFQLSTHFAFNGDEPREFSIELDPRTVSPDTLGLLKGLRFNRLSMGVQDFDPKVQEAINRKQSVAKVRALTEAARSYGFRSIGFDLIYGLPEQSQASLLRTAEQVVTLKPDRIALYNYAHLPQRFPSQRAIDRKQLPNATEKLQMLCAVAQTFQQNGYRYIGMDHFVLEGDEMDEAEREGRLQRSFQGYSIAHAPTILGLGVSAISSLPGSYAQNEKGLDAYYAAVDQGHLPVAAGLSLSRDDRLRGDLINRLICNLHVDIADFEQAYEVDFYDYFADECRELAVAEADGLVSLNKHAVDITERGRLLLRNVCMAFDKYLAQSAAKFSRTV